MEKSIIINILLLLLLSSCSSSESDEHTNSGEPVKNHLDSAKNILDNNISTNTDIELNTNVSIDNIKFNNEDESIKILYKTLESIPEDDDCYDDYKDFVEHIVVNGKIENDSLKKYQTKYLDCLIEIEQRPLSSGSGSQND